MVSSDNYGISEEEEEGAIGRGWLWDREETERKEPNQCPRWPRKTSWCCPRIEARAELWACWVIFGTWRRKIERASWWFWWRRKCERRRLFGSLGFEMLDCRNEEHKEIRDNVFIDREKGRSWSKVKKGGHCCITREERESIWRWFHW